MRASSGSLRGLDEDLAITVEREGRLVAAVELVSPRSKDRSSARDQYAGRYLNYLRDGVHLLLVDVHRQPIGFSFAQAIATALDENLTAIPARLAITYRVGPAAAQGGRLLAIWQQPLQIEADLPTMPLPLTADLAVSVPLEATYSRAAADCYLP